MAVTDKGYVIKVTGPVAAATTISTKFLRLGGILWYKPTTVGHLLNITDGADNVFVPGYCDTADVSQWWDFDNHPVNGLKVDDMDSGTLYIYVKRGR